MLALLKLLIISLAVLTIIYAAISLWSRGKRRIKLEEAWAEDPDAGDRDSYIREGLRAYDRSFRRKLILGVYIVPLSLVALITYLTNFN